jgi:plasmid stability protein
MSRAEPQLNVRVPESLKFMLETAARAHGRSVTAELVARLTASLEAEKANSAFGIAMRAQGYLPVRRPDGSVSWRVLAPTEQQGGWMSPEEAERFMSNTPDVQADPRAPSPPSAPAQSVPAGLAEALVQAVRVVLAEERARSDEPAKE